MIDRPHGGTRSAQKPPPHEEALGDDSPAPSLNVVPDLDAFGALVLGDDAPVLDHHGALRAALRLGLVATSVLEALWPLLAEDDDAPEAHLPLSDALVPFLAVYGAEGKGADAVYDDAAALVQYLHRPGGGRATS